MKPALFCRARCRRHRDDDDRDTGRRDTVPNEIGTVLSRALQQRRGHDDRDIRRRDSREV